MWKRHTLSIALALLPLGLRAQAVATNPSAVPAADADSAQANNNNIGPAGIIPVQKGFNLSLISTSQTDEVTGWSSLLIPALAYRLNSWLSADLSPTTYLSVPVTQSADTVRNPVTQQVSENLVMGDTPLAAHLSAPLSHTLGYQITPAISFPTGDSTHGLGAGKVTWDVNNHLDLDNALQPFVEFGIGDSSSLINRRVSRKSQLTVGTLAHFQAGLGHSFYQRVDVNGAWYETLPIGDQDIYTTRPIGKKTYTRQAGTGLAEDNGLNLSADLTLTPHLIASGFYNRSIRQDATNVGFSITFLWKAKPKD